MHFITVCNEVILCLTGFWRSRRDLFRTKDVRYISAGVWTWWSCTMCKSLIEISHAFTDYQFLNNPSQPRFSSISLLSPDYLSYRCHLQFFFKSFPLTLMSSCTWPGSGRFQSSGLNAGLPYTALPPGN